MNRLAALFITIQDGGRKDRPSYGEAQSEPAGDGREANLSYRRSKARGDVRATCARKDSTGAIAENLRTGLPVPEEGK